MNEIRLRSRRFRVSQEPGKFFEGVERMPTQKWGDRALDYQTTSGNVHTGGKLRILFPKA